MPSGPEWFIVLAVVLVIFGGSQLPKLAKNLGQAQRREFKHGLAESEQRDFKHGLAESDPSRPAEVLSQLLPAQRARDHGEAGPGTGDRRASAVDAAQAGPGQVADLLGDDVGIELLAAFDEAPARPLGEADEGVGERQAVLVVDVGGDQRGDRLHHAVRHPAHGPAELLVASMRRRTGA